MSDGIKEESRKGARGDRTETYVGCNNYKDVGGRKRYKAKLFENVLDGKTFIHT